MTKVHMPKEEDWKFKRLRKDDEHIKKCQTGYRESFGVQRMSEVHHILNVHSCTDDNIPSGSDRDFIHACFVITDWNINDGHNTIGLPTKWAYVLDDGIDPNWNNLPCHQVDHNLYWVTVDAYVQQEIFKKLASSRSKKECEKVTGQNIKAEFDAGSDQYRTFLEDRGREHGGTQACLEYARMGGADSSLEDKWYVPFSMAPNPETIKRRAKPPGREIEAELLRKGLLEID